MNKNLVQTYFAVIVITLMGLLLIKELNISYPLNLTMSSRTAELSVVGEGKVEVVPDTATVDIGITVNRAATVDSAQKSIDQVNNKIIQEMKTLGISEKDIKTSNYSINPNYAYDKTSSIDGYNGFTSITVKTKKIALVNQIVTKATAAGANQINGIQFSVDDPGKFREQARQKAIENAKEQAAELSKELGIKLGKVTNIVESSNNNGGSLMPYKADVMMAGGGGGGPEVQPGSQEISSVVTLYFDKR